MPITAIALRNFMAFRDGEWLELRKLTLLLGRNSSGKTSLIRALRLLKQSLETNNPDQPLQFVVDGGLDVGSFDAVIHRAPEEVPPVEHIAEFQAEDGASSNAAPRSAPEEIEPVEGVPESQKEVEKIEWSEPLSFMFRGSVPLYSLSTDGALNIPDYAAIPRTSRDDAPVGFELTLTYRQNRQSERVMLTSFEMSYRRSNGNSQEDYIWFRTKFDPYSIHPWRATSHLLPGKLDIELAEHLGLHCPNGFLPEITEGPMYSQLEQDGSEQKHLNGIRELWLVFKREICSFLESIKYVGPIRPAPERFYLITPETRAMWQRLGANAFLEYLAGKDEDDRDKRIAKWLEILKLGKYLRRVVEYRRKDGLLISSSLVLEEFGRQRTNVNLKDIGYGASQIIPVIVQCLAAPADALIILEQPELHLHPTAQADVADMVIESINQRLRTTRPRPSRPGRLAGGTEGVDPDDESLPENVTRRYLIETHSETLLLRLQVRLAEQSLGINTEFPLSDADFKCYFVERPDSGISSIAEICIDEEGSYGANIPSRFIDFFGQDHKELLKLMEAAKLRRQARNRDGDRS